jgi:toxin ParE1/3/4
MTRVAVSADARADVDGILSYLRREASAGVAARYAAHFRDLVRRLADHPMIGAPRPSLGPAARVAVVSPYLVIYEYESGPDTVTLLRVLHGRRRIAASMLPC